MDGTATLRLAEYPFAGPVAAQLIDEVQAEYAVRYGAPDEGPIDAGEFDEPHGRFYVAWVGPDAVGCAGLRRHEDGVAEIKRMYVRAGHRRRGLARQLLARVEDAARAAGYRRIVLESGVQQPEALALYATSGYAPIPNFGYYTDSPSSRCFGRDL